MAEPLEVPVMNGRWPLLGDLPAFQMDSTGFLSRIAREQGDVARFRLGRTDAFLLTHPDRVREVLVDRAAEFSKGRLMQRARRLLGDGLLTSEGELHRTQRRRIQPVFTRERLHSYFSMVPEIGTEHCVGWTNGNRVLLGSSMDELAMRIVARALLGADIGRDAPMLRDALHLLARWAPLLAAPGARILERSRLPILRRFRVAVELIEDTIDRQIAAGGGNAPLLQALMTAGSGDPMPRRLLRDEVMTIFLAGHDTTAAALSWLWLLLGVDTDADTRLQSELAAVLDGRAPCADDLARLPYATMVVKETLRLYPPISRIGRRPRHDIDLGTLTLPRDAAVFLSPYVTHRDRRWFVDPDEFRPDRWAHHVPERPRFAWFPFGAGPRSCIGEHFALGVLVLTLATLAQRWKLEPATTTLPGRRSLLTLKPRGTVWMNARAR
jgi:cytochrome P450